MRWFWIDRFVEFRSGERAVAIKNVTLAEEHLFDYVPGYPVMPASLMIEGMAQTGGILVAEQSDFERRVVLAKIAQARFVDPVLAGQTIRYTANLQTVQGGGGMVKGTCHVDDRLCGEIELFFAHLDDRFAGVELFEPAGLLQMLRLLKLFEVGRAADGSPLAVPPRLLEAEQNWLRDQAARADGR